MSVVAVAQCRAGSTAAKPRRAQPRWHGATPLSLGPSARGEAARAAAECVGRAREAIAASSRGRGRGRAAVEALEGRDEREEVEEVSGDGGDGGQ